MKKLVSCILSLSMICSLVAGLTVTANAATNIFGNEYKVYKAYKDSHLTDAAIGGGYTISTSGSGSYHNVTVRDDSSPKNKADTEDGYYPDSLKSDGYYLFMGTGGNSTLNTTVKLPADAADNAGKYMKITYAKPLASNGSIRNSGNPDADITVGTETINVAQTCEFDKWYTTTVKLDSAVPSITVTVRNYAAVAVSDIEIIDSADMMELTVEDNVTEKYITPQDQTVQYIASVFGSVTTLAGSDEIVARGAVDESADVEYSVDYDGVSIDVNGLLTITSSAQPGTVTVTAKYGEVVKTAKLLLKALGNADAVSIYGNEVVVAGNTAQYMAIPSANGVVMPERKTEWEIAGDTHGASIEGGVLTVPDTATAGVITIKATLAVSEVQLAEVSTEFDITIRTADSAKSPYEIKGLLLKNGETDITTTSGIDGVIVEKKDNANGDYMISIKVFDENNMVIGEKNMTLSGLKNGVQSVDCGLDFKKAAFAKLYVTKAAQDEEYTPTENTYDIIKAIKDGTKLTKVVIMQNDKTTETEAKLIIAQYDEKALKTTAIQDVTLTEGVNTIGMPDVTLTGSDVKVMLWKDTDETIEPLTDALTEISEETENVAGAVVSDEIFRGITGEYKNIPLVSDWVTNKELGIAGRLLKPAGAPAGVDPELVDVSTQNVTYSYDTDYKGADADNALWYKEAAYLASSGNSSNSIYDMHSVDWEREALPIGNGYMAGMLFGTPDKDQIQFNEETFWAAGYRGTQTKVNPNTVNPNMSEGINGYMSVGNIFVDFGMPKGAQVKNYYRDLNLDDAVAHVRYKYDGVKYNREYFASYPKEVLAFRYTAEDGELNFTVNPVSMHPGEVTVNDGEITIIGKLKDSEPYGSGGNATWSQESDLEYCTKIKVIADDGTVTDGYNKVSVSGATGVTILVAAATDYDKDQFELNDDGTVNMTKTPYKSTRGVEAAIEKATGRIDGAADMTYDALKAEHLADYHAQFNTVKFSLTGDEVYDKPTDELQKSYDSVISTKATADGGTEVSYDKTAYANLSNHLEELHFNYARYMMISSSRSDTMPANLQGKWCQSVAEIWGSCYCININMEMNYWFAGGANLLDSAKSLIGWFNSQIPAGKITAKNMYGVTPKSYVYDDGTITFTDSAEKEDDVFIMHTKQAIMGTTDLTGSTSIQSAGNTAWLMYNLWDIYQTSGDKELLENDLYPIMRQVANFYTQYLYKNEKKTTTDTGKYPDGYYYTTWTGRSPEQGPTEEGIKYDLQLVAGMYDYTIAAAETLGVDADKVAAWKEIRNHLELPVELGDDGQIKEWAEETKYNTGADGTTALGDPHHRHISHLVGLYPGTLITRDDKDLLEGAKIVLQNRGDDSTGWSCSNKFLLWARTLEGDKALELFRFQLAKKTYANLFDTHDPFQIDGNFGSAAGVMELLMQSQTGTVYILPALPSVWENGEISGIKAKNGATVSIKWENNQAKEIKITPAHDGDIIIGYEKDNTLTMGGADVTFTDGKYTIESAVAGTEYVFVSK